MEQRKIQFKELPENLQDELRDAPISRIGESCQIHHPMEYMGKKYIAKIPLSGQFESLIFDSFQLDDKAVFLDEISN